MAPGVLFRVLYVWYVLYIYAQHQARRVYTAFLRAHQTRAAQLAMSLKAMANQAAVYANSTTPDHLTKPGRAARRAAGAREHSTMVAERFIFVGTGLRRDVSRLADTSSPRKRGNPRVF